MRFTLLATGKVTIRFAIMRLHEGSKGFGG